MNKILSINNKFLKLDVKDFTNLIEKYNFEKIIQGFEFSIKTLDKKDYIKNFIMNVDKDYIFNLHSPVFQSRNEIYEYFEFAKEISLISKRKINIVVHPINGIDEKDSIEKTIEFLDTLFKIIEEKKYNEYFYISIENLNDKNGLKRLKKENFINMFEKFDKLCFTYDIGHEIIDGIECKNLENIFIEKMNNIHIHTYNKITNEDHYPIYEIDKEKTIKELLEKYGMSQNVVLEYALDYINGNTFEEKLRNYIDSAKLLIF